MNDKIMAGGNLENILARLGCCHSLLDTVRWDMEGKCKTHEEALFAVSDLLGIICRDFAADIDAAEDYTGKEAKV